MNLKVTKTHGHNILLGHKGKMLWIWSRVLSAPMDEMKVNAFILLSLSVVLNEKLFYLRSSAAFKEVAAAKSPGQVPSSVACVLKRGGFIVSR